jgi:tRNA (guanine37-N1)-methyltransferase
MRVDILTIFPQLFAPFLTLGMVRRARELGSLEVRMTDLRAFTEDRHRTVDDRPYGGGPGMLLKPEPVFRALDALGIPGTRPEGDPRGISRSGGGEIEASEPGRSTEVEVPSGTELILLCPRGERLEQAHFEEFSGRERLVFLCGRYEGYDERILEAYPWRHLSVGDYVLSGGEVPAMTIIEGVSRLLPGVLGDETSARRDSFGEWAGESAGEGGLDHASWTRPASYRGREVPEILKSGDHGRIETWRRERSREATESRRRMRLRRNSVEGRGVGDWNP